MELAGEMRSAMDAKRSEWVIRTVARVREGEKLNQERSKQRDWQRSRRGDRLNEWIPFARHRVSLFDVSPKSRRAEPIAARYQLQLIRTRSLM